MLRMRSDARALTTWFGTVLLLAVTLIPAAAEAASNPCERVCLERFVDRYLDAMLAHDPKRVPFSPGARFTENGQTLEPGDGLWRTITARGTYRMLVADAESGHVAFLGSIREADTPAMLAVHLRIRKGQISAVETLVQRNEKSALGFEEIGYTWRDTLSAREQLSREELVKTANMYFSGMERNDGNGVYPFEDNCNRIENGTFTTNAPTPPGQTRPDPKSASNYSSQWSCREQFESGLLHFVSRIRDRRFVAVDPERGLVFSYIFFDHMAGDTRTFQTPDGRTVTAGPKQPWTWELAEAFRIEHGKIHQIVAIMEHVPYGMSSGWSTWEESMSSLGRDVTN
ncbi:MAG: hypothetical protein JWM63_2423 [Gammaproteobacteria bacterium]|jgi:hypothetical protein|nr:hypothetical protein [Gammaproteobacteria bacterium]